MKANLNQDLILHSNKIFQLAKKIIDYLNLDYDNFLEKEKLEKILMYSCLFHDIGKIDPNFQNFLKEKEIEENENGCHIKTKKEVFSFENYPRHNEISYFIFKEMLNIEGLKNPIKYIIENVILWHHAKPIRKKELEYTEIKAALRMNKVEFYKNLTNFIKELKDDNIKIKDLDDSLNIPNQNMYRYKIKFSESSENKNLEDIILDIKTESVISLIRTVLITADRLISSIGDKINNPDILDFLIKQLNNNDNKELMSSLIKMKARFDVHAERSIIQDLAVKEMFLKKSKINILSAPAGSGKTKTALEWAFKNNASKIYFIVPRTIIAEELYEECKNTYFHKNDNIVLQILTGQKSVSYFKGKEKENSESDFFKADIIFTTIDQVIKTITTHKNIAVLLDILKSHTIFDEYHEYYKMPAFDLLFAEIINLKKNTGISKTLLMSATVNLFFLEDFLELNEKEIVYFKSLNDKEYKIKFNYYNESEIEDIKIIENNIINFYSNEILDKNPLYKKYNDKKTIIISNTATTAQLSYIINNNKEKSILAHSKFSIKDKFDSLEIIKNNFKNIKNKENMILRAGPIVQASLNITSERLVTEMTTPENTLQRLGRLNRFSEDFIGEFIIGIPESLKDLNIKISNFEEKDLKVKNNGLLKILNMNKSIKSSLLWYLFIKENLNIKENEASFKLEDIYKIYDNFYRNEKIKEIIKKEFIDSLRYSYSVISYNIIDPIEFINKKFYNKKDKSKLSKKSLRGKNYYSKLATYEIKDGVLKLTNEYKLVNISRDEILLHNKNPELIEYSKQKLKYIESKNKDLKKIKKMNPEQYLNLSRSDEYPIYLSFIEKDLDIINASQKENSYIYLKCGNKNIGYIQYKKIIGEKNE